MHWHLSLLSCSFLTKKMSRSPSPSSSSKSDHSYREESESRWNPLCRWLLFSPYAGQRTGFRLPTLCGIESTSRTIFLEVLRANHQLSLWLWTEILPFDSNKPDPQISRSVGWARMQSLSCSFVAAVPAALNNSTTSYHIELNDLRTFLKNITSPESYKKLAMCRVWVEKMTSLGFPRSFLRPALKHW